MALAANALTTVAEMESILGLASGSKNSELTRAINRASAIADSYAGRVFYRQTAITEKHPGQTGPILLLDQAPINSITSVKYLDGDAESSTTYEIHDADVGEVYRVSGNWAGIDTVFRDASLTAFTGQGRKTWTIVYDAGWYTPQQAIDLAVTRTLPYDIEHAVCQIAVQLYRAEGRDPSLRSESLMKASQSFAAGGSGDSSWLKTVVPSAAAILDRYKRGWLG
jgi:hypothetical protein